MQRRRRKSALPLSLAVYLESQHSPGRRPITPGDSVKNRLFSKLFEEGKAGKRAGIKRQQRGSVEGSRPISDLAVALDDDILREKIATIQGQIADLQAKHSALLRENNQIRMRNQRSCEPILGIGENWDREGVIREIDDLHLLLSNAHKGINALKIRENSAISEVLSVEKELGMLKYRLELCENTKEVKSALLSEAIHNQSLEQAALHKYIHEYRADCIVTDQEIADLQRINSEICLELQGLEQRSSSGSLNLADLYGKLSIARSLIEKTEERVAACQAFISIHSPDL